MKKLIMAAAIVCAAVVAHASTANWRWTGSSTTTLYTYGSSSTALGSATIYIFADGQQENVFNKWKTDGTMLSGEAQLDSKSVTAGKIAAVDTTTHEFQYGEAGTKYSFFTALIDSDGNLFISGKTMSTKGTEPDIGTALSISLAKSTYHVEDSESYSSAGWYTAVPEPTSGLLLLLGMAGLALRRRRA